MTTIQNLPAYAADYRYTVARFVEGEWWFWGAYDELRRASHAAFEEGGEVFETSEIVAGDYLGL